MPVTAIVYVPNSQQWISVGFPRRIGAVCKDIEIREGASFRSNIGEWVRIEKISDTENEWRKLTISSNKQKISAGTGISCSGDSDREKQ